MTDKITIQLTADFIKELSEQLMQVCFDYVRSGVVTSTTRINGTRLTLIAEIFDFDNAAFQDQDNEVPETCRILKDLALTLRIDTDRKLIDINGNSVGRATVTEAELIKKP